MLSWCPPPLSLLRFPLSRQPDFSCLPSRFLYSASLFVSFRSTLFHSHSRSTGAHLPFSLPVFFTSSSHPFVCVPSASSYSAFCSSFPSLPGSASQLLSQCPPPLSLPRFLLSLWPDFSCLPSRFSYSASLMVSFRPSLIHSRSCSSGAYLVLSLSVFSLPIHILSSASLPVLATQPLFLPFLSLLGPASQWLLRCRLSAFQLPCFSTSAPPDFPCFTSVSKYLASCLFPFILPDFAPTAVPSVLPLCSRPRAFPSHPLSFVRFCSVLTTQPSALSFPFFPNSPDGGSSGATFLFRPACFHAFHPIPVLSALQFLSPLAGSPHSGYLSASAFLLLDSSRSPWLSL